MTGPVGSGHDGGDFDPDFAALAARYDAESAGIEPPAHLDAQLIAAAHRAVAARPHPVEAKAPPVASLLRRYRAPFALAASIVVVGSVAVGVWKESPEKFTTSSEPPPFAATMPTSSVPQDNSPAAGVAEAAPAPARQVEQAKLKATPSASRSAPPVAVPAAPALRLDAAPTSKQQPMLEPQADADAASDQSLGRTRITGSGTRRADVDAPSPVQMVAPAERPAERVAPAAPAAAQAAPPGPSISPSGAPQNASNLLLREKQAVAPAPAPGAASLLAALRTAADAHDLVAAQTVLDTIKLNYPATEIPERLRIELIDLGVSVPRGPLGTSPQNR